MGLVVAGSHLAAPSLLGIAPLSGAWWATRPLWLAGLALATVPLVVLAGWAEHRLAPVDAPSGRRLLVATTTATVGLTTLVFAELSTMPAVATVLLAAVLGRWLPVPATRRRPTGGPAGPTRTPRSASRGGRGEWFDARRPSRPPPVRTLDDHRRRRRHLRPR